MQKMSVRSNRLEIESIVYGMYGFVKWLFFFDIHSLLCTLFLNASLNIRFQCLKSSSIIKSGNFRTHKLEATHMDFFTFIRKVET